MICTHFFRASCLLQFSWNITKSITSRLLPPVLQLPGDFGAGFNPTGSNLNRSITLSTIDEISCAKTNIRACPALCPVAASLHRGAEAVLLRQSITKTITDCNDRSWRAKSPCKQAVGAEAEADDRFNGRASVTNFSDTYRRTWDAECEWT